MAWGDVVLPDPLRKLACVVRTAAALCFLLGVRARTAGFVAGGLGLVAMSQDPFAFVYTLYTLFVGTLVFATTNATRERAWLPEPPTASRTSSVPVRVFVGSIYGLSAIAKMHPGWLGGATLAALSEDGFFDERTSSLLRAHSTFRLGAAWGSMGAELALGAVFLLSCAPRWRVSPRVLWVAIFAAVSTHVAFEVVARPDVIGWIMASLLVACAPASTNDECGAPDARQPPLHGSGAKFSTP
jgi:hypothetical protein